MSSAEAPAARAALAAVVAATVMVTAAVAQDGPTAVGRITYAALHQAGDALCTGTLIAPDTVLTAGHCVAQARDRPASIRFQPGFGHGSPLGEEAPLFRGQAIVLAPAPTADRHRMTGDLALLRLDAPVPPDIARPLAMGPGTAARFSVLAYSRTAPDAPLFRDDCTLIATLPGLMGLTCPVVSGHSGAPVLQQGLDGWQVVAVIVAQSGPPVRAWAVIPDPAFLARAPD